MSMGGSGGGAGAPQRWLCRNCGFNNRRKAARGIGMGNNNNNKNNTNDNNSSGGADPTNPACENCRCV